MKSTTIVIHWRGPFADVQNLPDGYGLYLLAGKCRYERCDQIQYCGITENGFYKRFRNHHKLGEIKRNLSIWIGEVVYPQNPERYCLEMAEKMLVYFWQPKLNDRLRYTPPQATNLISHWFKKNGEPLRNQKAIYRNLPDVLCWDGELWRTGNLYVYPDW